MSFQINFGYWDFKRHWASCMEPFSFFRGLFCTIPHLRQLLRKMPQLWFAVKLQKFCVDYEQWLSLGMRVGRWWLNFLFSGELFPFNVGYWRLVSVIIHDEAIQKGPLLLARALLMPVSVQYNIPVCCDLVNNAPFLTAVTVVSGELLCQGCSTFTLIVLLWQLLYAYLKWSCECRVSSSIDSGGACDCHVTPSWLCVATWTQYQVSLTQSQVWQVPGSNGLLLSFL